MATHTREQFAALWANSTGGEQQTAQSHFNMLCQVLGFLPPNEADPTGETFTFEKKVEKASGGSGRADVWKKDHFAWEYKGKDKDLDAAYHQVQSYRGGLNNPPLLVVSDMERYRIHPQWVSIPDTPFEFTNEDLKNPKHKGWDYLRWLLENPDNFLAERLEELAERETITIEIAQQFAHLANLMEQYGAADWDRQRIARFLTKLVFALFAEDVGLLPKVQDKPVFRYLAENARDVPQAFATELQNLFRAMRGDTEIFYMKRVPYFNGGLFMDSTPGAGDGLDVLDLTIVPGALDLLSRASEKNWSRVNPTIFGNLFEEALDPSKRAELGAHYTSETDIRLIVEPVLMEPLYREWEAIRAEAEPLMQRYLDPQTPRNEHHRAAEQLTALHQRMMHRLEKTTVLDPACGSGNFLYVSLRMMKDLEGRVRVFFDPLNLPFRDVVTPRQIFGIEKSVFAAKLAHVVVWIGYLQWRYEDEDQVLHPVYRGVPPHERSLPDPILKDKINDDDPDRIVNDDAILRYDADGKPYEPVWQPVDVIVGNPPFLGHWKRRSELGEAYQNDLLRLYGKRVPNDTDLVCYWFERARQEIKENHAKRAGLIATNSIRGGSNRYVLERIKETGDIFLAHSDREWILEGAAVRISIVAFDDGQEEKRTLDDQAVTRINPDLTSDVDLTTALSLPENTNLSARGIEAGGPFGISDEQAQKFMSIPKNKQIIVPSVNAQDITSRSDDSWLVDFDRTPDIAPTEYKDVYDWLYQQWQAVLNDKSKKRKPKFRDDWWKYRRSGEKLREILNSQTRYLCTPRVAKHRLWVWIESPTVPDSALYAFARDDDYFFGVLHSYLHEIWSLRMGTWLGKGNDPRYTPTTTFETFPLPWSPGSEPTDDPRYQAIAAAAQQLHQEREAWLNPPELTGEDGGRFAADQLKKRTLTNLYNALDDHRNGNNPRTPTPASTFAPRLAELHDHLDRAVLAAYGWDDLAESLRTESGDESILRRLLDLNQARATG